MGAGGTRSRRETPSRSSRSPNGVKTVAPDVTSEGPLVCRCPSGNPMGEMVQGLGSWGGAKGTFVYFSTELPHPSSPMRPGVYGTSVNYHRGSWFLWVSVSVTDPCLKGRGKRLQFMNRETDSGLGLVQGDELVREWGRRRTSRVVCRGVGVRRGLLWQRIGSEKGPGPHEGSFGSGRHS